MRPFCANNPISAKAVCDLPDPDSPTIPSVSPARSEKFKSLTAVTSPSLVVKVTRRSFTASSRSALLSVVIIVNSLTIFRVEGITQAIADKVETE